ncbi:prephenate dehydrogenase/arogenate dehydrogenase family protein, partial [bacterium]|nr:prephenate dehydrogenase/arogenate dehydrogenase family protein [bacterium]
MEYGAGGEEHPDPELVVVCVPPDLTAEVVAAQLAKYPSAIVTDVASVKSEIAQRVGEIAGAEAKRYVGLHPMAGRERGGPGSARADLFFARPWVITPSKDNPQVAVELVKDLGLKIGALPVLMSAREHDAAVALVSHLPQLVASALAARLLDGKEDQLALTGQGLRDTARVAASDPDLWLQILTQNADLIAPLLAELREDIADLEKSFAGFPRSYPDGMEDADNDALAWSPAGFIWDSALAAGKTVRNYGEFMMPRVRWKDPAREGSPDFAACYAAWKAGPEASEVIFAAEPAVESLRPHSPLDTVGWNMSVPDQFRADVVLEELADYEQQGRYPNLTIICLPQDHTSGTSPGCPTPAACMADNDLAVGRIVEGLSQSSFWPKMAIFIIEDDPQAGWDHVSGYRTTAYLASPFAKRQVTVSTQYNSTSVLRTIGQILGLPPMNLFDASATPMVDCFVATADEADLRPYEALPVSVPLDEMNPSAASLLDPLLKAHATASSQMNFAQIDRAPEDLLNRVLWHAMRG